MGSLREGLAVKEGGSFLGFVSGDELGVVGDVY